MKAEKPFYFHWEEEKRLYLRCMRPEDKLLIREVFMHRISERSMYTRFFTSNRRLTEQQLDYLTHVDNQDHLGWLAWDASQWPWGETRESLEDAIGGASFFRDPAEPEAAEVSVTIVDAWQRRGIGTLLLGLMCLLAERRGIKFFTAVMVQENSPVVQSMRLLGAEVGQDAGNFIIRMPLHLSLDYLPEHELHRQFLRLLSKLRAALPAVE